jgi:ferric-dicitrate binding protein FerR (iron transport regulator)
VKTKPSSSEQEVAVQALGRLAQEHLDGEQSPEKHAAERDRFVFALRERIESKNARRHTAALWLLPAAAAMTIAIVVWRMGWLEPRLTYSVDAMSQSDNGYVRVSDGARPATVRFSDGSEIRVDPGAELRVEDLARDGARVALFKGRTGVHVVHRDRTRWAVAAGPFVVRVTGTSFDVAWTSEEAKLEVALRSGSVVVEGPLTRAGVRLSEGHRLVASLHEDRLVVESLDAPRPEKVDDVGAAQPPDHAPAAQTPATDPSSLAARGQERSWSKRVAAGDYASVVADAQARGLDSTLAQAPLADLVALADAARYAGQRQIARRALMAQRNRFAGSEDARAAAFVIGAMIQDSDGSPGAAVEWFERYLSESPRGPFYSDALGRKMLAVRKISGVVAARSIAQAYLAKYPDGAYAAAAKEIAASP